MYKFTNYFENEVLRKRPYLTKELCEFVIENAIRVEIQNDERISFWARVETLLIANEDVRFC